MAEALPAGAGSPRGEEVLAAAIRVFARSGTGEVTLHDVAREAEATVATVSYHFSNKEQLFEAALAHVLEDLNAVIESARPTGQETDARGLDAVVDAVWGWFAEHPHSSLLYRSHLQSATGAARALRDEFVALHVGRAFAYLPAERRSARGRFQAQTLALRSLIASLDLVAGAQAEGPLSAPPSADVQRAMRAVARQLITG